MYEIDGIHFFGDSFQNNGVWRELVIAHYLMSLEDERINGANLKSNPISFDVLHSLLLIVILAKKKKLQKQFYFLTHGQI